MKEAYSLNRYSLQPVEILRSSNCWSLRLALNQKLAGSIPASGTEVSYGGRPVLVQELGCDPSLYRFNSVRSPFGTGFRL